MGDSCGFCGVTYERFRSPDGMTWADAQQVQWDRSVDNAARGDYSTPLTRAAVLGKLRQWKLEAWDRHQYLCGETVALEALRSVDQHAMVELGQWDELAAVQDAIAEIERDLGIYEEDPF